MQTHTFPSQTPPGDQRPKVMQAILLNARSVSNKISIRDLILDNGGGVAVIHKGSLFLPKCHLRLTVINAALREESVPLTLLPVGGNDKPESNLLF